MQSRSPFLFLASGEIKLPSTASGPCEGVAALQMFALSGGRRAKKNLPLNLGREEGMEKKGEISCLTLL